MFAVLLSGAKQYLVKEGDVITVEKLPTPVGQTHTFDKILLVSQDGKSVDVGMPFVKTSITAKVTKQGKADKIRVFKMKAKKNYRRTSGHRQPFTEVEITKIG
jgi:large subunit ribosomal protein L21